MSDSDTVPLQDTQNAIPSEGVNIARHATGTKVASEDKASKTQKAEDRYLQRFQVRDNAAGVWRPYDPSFIKPVPRREDLANYFYLDIRYQNERSHPDLVVTNFSRVLIDFLRHTFGGVFFKTDPEYFLLDFFARIHDLRAGLAAVRDALASNLAGEDLKLKAKDMGCTDALGLHKTEEDARRYFEDVAEHLGVLLGMIEKEFEPTAQELELQLSYGHIAFDLLKYYFERGVKYYILQKDDLAGFTLSSTWYNQDSTFLALEGETTRWDGHKYINEKMTFSIPKYDGTVELSKLSCKIMTDDVRAKLIARGNLYSSFSGGFHYKSYKGSRIVIDERAFNESQGHIRDPDEKISDVPEGKHDQLPAFVNGFELKSKEWKSFHVENIDDVRFDEKAWDHLVVDDDVKSLIRGLVDVTRNVNTSQHLISDVITGKGGGLRPLYIVSSPELSTEPSKLESNLSEILKLATAWDAVVLIDEADVFLEQRSLHDLERNALVSVALKVFEYHRGVLFLTTNRIKTFDDAFLSRFSIAIKYPELDASARLTIWQKFFELAGCPLWGSESEEFVDIDGKEPRCYVSLSDLEVLAQKPFNGRTIKNLVRTAQALALSAKEPLSLDHIKVVVRAQEKFLTEFAQIRS
ncbi:P-loop containing nucleoside triphosphate hydrolase protein [Suillus subalutaceus]|uniref:P-loop containing nucleoside triphosphate hydrolase protein n=1 Tax=Suillus subalutaceus TaxID=48586 RepID=UPI001B86B1D9|nr:P-loop containing nucleoside triphosphate hydrolase protein [Suillus subalutaceus]KAG1873648.1 P-loop containing nucleoside triphosphate hydrolase protein [Suillus subalutaceus]